MRALLLGLGLVVVIVGGGAAWAMTQPGTSRMCTAAGSLDEVGAETAEAARIHWAAEYDLDVDIEHPDRIGGSGDEETADYTIPTPVATHPAEAGRSYFRRVVTQRGADDVWRVTSANRCAEW